MRRIPECRHAIVSVRLAVGMAVLVALMQGANCSFDPSPLGTPENVEPPASEPEPAGQPAPPSEPEPAGASAPLTTVSLTPNVGPTEGGTPVTITGTGFKTGLVVLFGGHLGIDVTVANETTLSVVTPAYAAGVVNVTVILPNGKTSTLAGAFTYEAPEDEVTDTGALRVVGAVARDTHHVVVTFNREVGPSAENPLNYEITGSGTAYLTVQSATRRAGDFTVVELATLTQGPDLYTVHVVAVKDLEGNPIAPPDGLLAAPNGPDPSRAQFAGIPPGALAEHIDSDGDDFADWFEMQGWMVTVRFTNGTIDTFHVTSDPFNPDTDGDGFTDATENALSLDPRTDDTDADWVPDPEEYDDWRSDPADQDTDRDGFGDYLEITAFNTSPILADTDGDKFNDDEEILFRNRNPRLADLPLPRIVVGGMNVEVSESYSYTDETGEEQTHERSSSSTVSKAEEKAFATASTRTNEKTYQWSQQLEAGYSDKSPVAKLTLGAEQGLQYGYSYETSAESRQAMQEEYSDSIGEALTVSERREVSRAVESARISAEVTLINAGDLAFTISNVELSARTPSDDRNGPFVPLAALIPASGNSSFNLGPLDSQRGPFVFENAEIFPNRALELLRNPDTIMFEIANYDITDEFGRNFAFTSEEVNDRTAAITIDFGNGRVELYRVATASTFDAAGRSMGITMREALVDIIGLNEMQNDATVIDETTDLNDPAIRDSFGTIVGPVTGVQMLTRVRGVQTNLALADTDRRFWVVVSPADISPTTPFGDIVLHPRTSYQLWYVQDNDDDRLFAREEFIAGSSDENPDTDEDGIGDYDEVKTGWEVAIPGNRYRVFSSPAFPDTDFDLLSDPDEQRLQTDPTRRDTDADALSDRIEVDGYEVVLFDGDADTSNNPILVVEPYSDAAIIEPRAGGNGVADTVAHPNDTQVVAPGTTGLVPGTVIVRPGPDGILDTVPTSDDIRATEGQAIIALAAGPAATAFDAGSDDVQVTPVGAPAVAGQIIVRAGPDGILQTIAQGGDAARAVHNDLFGTDPLRRDTDGDGVADGREQLIGANPNIRDADTILDTDSDGLTDAEENMGWQVFVDGGLVGVKPSNPENPDTDGDGLPDALELALMTDPTARDTDGDGLSDLAEYDPADPANYFDDARMALFDQRCAGAGGCVFVPAASPVGTNPLDTDTDNDTRNDGDEVNVPWLVSVVGRAQYAVHSDPLAADGDGDSLLDNVELANGTDPTLADTDDDDVLDGAEVNNGQTDEFSGTTVKSNPLKPDRLVSVEYKSFLVVDDWDDGDGEDAGEFFWDFDFSVPGSGTLDGARGADPDVPHENLPNQPANFHPASNNASVHNYKRVFTLDVGGSFTAFGEVDEDDYGLNENDTASFSEVITITTFGTHTLTITAYSNHNDEMNTTVEYTVHQ